MTGDPIVLRGLGSFHIGGRTVEISGRPVATRALSPGGIPATIDPNDQYQVEAMYVQYFLPQSRKGKYPLLLWHGGGMTGVTYESTPDGREGWLNMFVRAGWDVYVCDSVERGRSSFAPPGVWGDEPIFLPKHNPFERFRIGPHWDADPKKMRALPGNQFPVEAYDNFVKQFVPRWATTDAAIIAAYIALLEKLGPCVVLCHSQGGGFGFRGRRRAPIWSRRSLPSSRRWPATSTKPASCRACRCLCSTETSSKTISAGRKCAASASTMRQPCARPAAAST
jgi:hypothetical protein